MCTVQAENIRMNFGRFFPLQLYSLLKEQNQNLKKVKVHWLIQHIHRVTQNSGKLKLNVILNEQQIADDLHVSHTYLPRLLIVGGYDIKAGEKASLKDCN